MVEGRSQNLILTEYVLVGPMLATLIASLSVRYRMSRTKIQEFLNDWTNTQLSTGTIDRCIREAGIACVPVVEELVAQLQKADILHLDETHWYESGKLHWLWVAVSTKTAVFQIGSRRKEELSYLVTEAFIGWLISDGYAAYRSYPKRQRCLAHLIRKAIAITGAINQKAATIGQWILDDLRKLMATISGGPLPFFAPMLEQHFNCSIYSDTPKPLNSEGRFVPIYLGAGIVPQVEKTLQLKTPEAVEQALSFRLIDCFAVLDELIALNLEEKELEATKTA